MDAITRYERAREAMLKHGIPILPEILTDYQNVMRAVLRSRPGLHPIVLIVDRNSDPRNMVLFQRDSVRNANVELEIR